MEGRAQTQPPPAVLSWLAAQVGLGAHLAKQRRQQKSSASAFTVSMPGSAGARSALATHDSSEDEVDFDDDDDFGGGGGDGAWGGGGGGA